MPHVQCFLCCEAVFIFQKQIEQMGLVTAWLGYTLWNLCIYLERNSLVFYRQSFCIYTDLNLQFVLLFRNKHFSHSNQLLWLLWAWDFFIKRNPFAIYTSSNNENLEVTSFCGKSCIHWDSLTSQLWHMFFLSTFILPFLKSAASPPHFIAYTLPTARV